MPQEQPRVQCPDCWRSVRPADWAVHRIQQHQDAKLIPTTNTRHKEKQS